ncbi:MAG: hypothetical protein HC834_10880 [Rhodospirillales bacterium]|nr:hypothetical protein [Rhodospirillales bacterium]
MSEQEIRQMVSRMNAGGRQSRRWLSEDSQVQLATGTDGRPAPAPKAKRAGLGINVGSPVEINQVETLRPEAGLDKGVVKN